MQRCPTGCNPQNANQLTPAPPLQLQNVKGNNNNKRVAVVKNTKLLLQIPRKFLHPNPKRQKPKRTTGRTSATKKAAPLKKVLYVTK